MICIAFQAKRGVMGFSHPRLRPGLLTLRSWRLPDAPVAEGDTSSSDDPHRLSPAERATVGGRRLPKPRRRLLCADAEGPDTKKGVNLNEIDS